VAVHAEVIWTENGIIVKVGNLAAEAKVAHVVHGRAILTNQTFPVRVYTLVAPRHIRAIRELTRIVSRECWGVAASGVGQTCGRVFA
jgi:hypothetical protein